MRWRHGILMVAAALYWSSVSGSTIALGVIAATTAALAWQRTVVWLSWGLVSTVIVSIIYLVPQWYAAIHLALCVAVLIPAYRGQVRWSCALWLAECLVHVVTTDSVPWVALALALAGWLGQYSQRSLNYHLMPAWTLVMCLVVAGALSAVTSHATIHPAQQEHLTDELANPNQSSRSTESKHSSTSRPAVHLSDRLDGTPPRDSKHPLAHLVLEAHAPRALDGCYLRLYPMKLQTSDEGWLWQRAVYELDRDTDGVNVPMVFPQPPEVLHRSATVTDSWCTICNRLRS